MTTPFKIKLFTLMFLVANVLTLRAENISGSYSNDCTSLVKLWDLTGTYTEDNGIETESITMNMDANGVITGNGHFDLTDDADSVYLAGDANISGKVTSAGKVTRVKLTLKITSGTGTVTGYDVTFLSTLNESFEVDDLDRMLIGKASGKIKLTVPAFGKTRSVPVPTGSVAANLPDEVDGNWGLTMDATPNGTKTGGTGVLNLSNGKTIDLGVTGTYSSKNDQSKISLKNADGSKSVALSIVGQSISNNLSILSLKGKALGQKLQYSTKTK
ncbi:MAG TPA: hypothetical protein VHC44_01630 [Verrucomicrobiae bacterium]|nr:hypothetical protein [Verrucomicrobiae bacterium]